MASVASLVAIELVVFMGPNGQMIEVNPESVVTLRAPRGEHERAFSPGAKCIIHTSDGKFVVVVEVCAEVKKRLQGAR